MLPINNVLEGTDTNALTTEFKPYLLVLFFFFLPGPNSSTLLCIPGYVGFYGTSFLLPHQNRGVLARHWHFPQSLCYIYGHNSFPNPFAFHIQILDYLCYIKDSQGRGKCLTKSICE